MIDAESAHHRKQGGGKAMNVDELFTGELTTGVPSMSAALLDKMPGGGDDNGDHCK